jgi:hypothetical protein
VLKETESTDAEALVIVPGAAFVTVGVVVCSIK